jgi:hypothetical protein
MGRAFVGVAAAAVMAVTGVSVAFAQAKQPACTAWGLGQGTPCDNAFNNSQMLVDFFASGKAANADGQFAVAKDGALEINIQGNVVYSNNPSLATHLIIKQDAPNAYTVTWKGGEYTGVMIEGAATDKPTRIIDGKPMSSWFPETQSGISETRLLFGSSFREGGASDKHVMTIGQLWDIGQKAAAEQANRLVVAPQPQLAQPILPASRTPNASAIVALLTDGQKDVEARFTHNEGDKVITIILKSNNPNNPEMRIELSGVGNAVHLFGFSKQKGFGGQSANAGEEEPITPFAGGTGIDLAQLYKAGVAAAKETGGQSMKIVPAAVKAAEGLLAKPTP